MKKVYFIFTIALMIAVVFQSCKKDEQPTPATIDLTKSATIKGKVKAELDNSNSTSESAPSGTKIIFQVSAQDFPLDPSGNYDDLLYTATVDANGDYTISVPVNNKGVNYTIRPVDFEYNQVQAAPAGSTIRKIYSAGSISVNGLITGETRIEDIMYF